MRENLKKVALFFEVAICFHPDQPWPKALILTLNVCTSEVVLNKPGPLFWVFINTSYMPFGFLN